MKYELPTILSAGLFESDKRYPTLTVSREREVRTYELEYYFEDGNISVINGREYAIRKGNILFARPGDLRHSHLHFTCRFLHFLVTDQRLAAALEKIPAVSAAADPRKAEAIFQETISLFYSADPFDGAAASARLVTLLHRLNQWTGEDPGTLTRAMRFIESSCGSNLTACDIADTCNVSVSWLYKLFREALDTTPGEYLLRCRISAAKDLLANTSLPLSEVASRCGFNSQSYFSDCFKKSAGISPREFRRNSVYPL